MTDSALPRPPRLIQNPLSILGLFIAAVATIIGLPMMFMDIFAPHSNPYAGIIIYFILPLLAGFGFLLAIAGVLWESRRRKRFPHKAIPSWPKIDLSRPTHRIVVLGALAAVALVSLLLIITGYRAYNYSDSVKFCGLVCHQVMKPEYTAYQNSPHARVTCVQCHIGPGVSWFVRSKITGAYQVYSVTFKKYEKPIKTPVHDLRPAQETCEQCHWPAKFFGDQQKIFSHVFMDEKNTPWRIQTLLKTGGGNPDVGNPSGIHWNMNIKNKISFVSADERREVIPWVHSVGPDGIVTEYISEESTLSLEEIAKRPVKQLDCIDCHNRPSHVFYSPRIALDRAFEARKLDPSLPYLKRESARLLSGNYATEEEALAAIDKGLNEFYQTHYSAIAESKIEALRQAADTVKSIYSRNMFPEMKTDWRSHPNHIGHLEFDGCFRCHDGQHKSKDGKVISNDCNICHTILAQGNPTDISAGQLKAQSFRHPVDMSIDVTQMKCTLCHSSTPGN
ncbi:MAG: NapC/NirT family cytochrome c [Elusimicrobia bacterium]|nr:NapC/NirT family cytochrome c [Candidatus Obscuribacterium magneticum]